MVALNNLCRPNTPTKNLGLPLATLFDRREKRETTHKTAQDCNSSRQREEVKHCKFDRPGERESNKVRKSKGVEKRLRQSTSDRAQETNNKENLRQLFTQAAKETTQHKTKQDTGKLARARDRERARKSKHTLLPLNQVGFCNSFS